MVTAHLNELRCLPNRCAVFSPSGRARGSAFRTPPAAVSVGPVNSRLPTVVLPRVSPGLTGSFPSRLLATCVTFGEASVRVVCPFLSWVVSLFLSQQSSLSRVQIPYVSPYYVGCIFTVLTVHFAAAALVLKFSLSFSVPLMLCCPS